MEPIAVDGRQLLSKPCDYDKGIYTRYNQSELFRVSENVAGGGGLAADLVSEL